MNPNEESRGGTLSPRSDFDLCASKFIAGSKNPPPHSRVNRRACANIAASSSTCGTPT